MTDLELLSLLLTFEMGVLVLVTWIVSLFVWNVFIVMGISTVITFGLTILTVLIIYPHREEDEAT